MDEELEDAAAEAGAEAIEEAVAADVLRSRWRLPRRSLQPKR